MKSRLLFGAVIVFFLSICSAYAQELLDVGSFSIGGKLVLDGIAHKVGESWRTVPSGINYEYTYNESTPTNHAWETTFGQTAFLDFGFRPFSALTGDIGIELKGGYADRYWLPINHEHRLTDNDEWFSWNRADIKYRLGGAHLRYFRGVGHFGWNYDGDLFGLYPEQSEVERYLRVSGRALPEGFEANAEGTAGRLQLILGNEVQWFNRNGIYAKYNYDIDNLTRLNLIYSDHIIPYGTEDERLRAVECTGDFDIAGNAVQVGVLYQPFRLNKEYVYVEDAAPGTGLLGSNYNRKTGTTTSNDALGFSSRLTLMPESIFGQMVFQYTYRGLVAGNKQQVDAQFTQRISRSVTGGLEGTFRKPLYGPVPLVFEGTAGNTGPTVFQPRGPESPFWVNWDNREAGIISAVCTYDPTPNTWFYQFQPNLPDEWNLNPEEDAIFSCMGKYTLSRYFTTTDRLTYYDAGGTILWEPACLTTPWPTVGYVGGLTVVGRLNLDRWKFIATAGYGESLALNSFAYTTQRDGEKPVTDYFTFNLSAKHGPYTGRFIYNQDYWGPEEWHRQFGSVFDVLYRGMLSRDFNKYMTAGLEYTAARKDPKQYFAPELGYYDEVRLYLTIAFGPVVASFGAPKPVEEPLVGEAPELDFTAPQVSLAVNEKSFSPDGDGTSDTLTLEPWATDYSGIARWEIAITDERGKAVRTISGEGQPPYQIAWDGCDDYYKKPVHAGTYRFVLTAVDEADNTAASEPVSVAVSYPPQIKIKEVPKEITITETDRGLLVSMTSRVLFDTARSTLKPTANKTLQELVKVLKAYVENKISVEGHTDSVGTDAYNQQLSEQRAQSVARYLIKAGISAERIASKGWGEAHPAASNATAAGREANRRVEVIILK